MSEDKKPENPDTSVSVDIDDFSEDKPDINKTDGFSSDEENVSYTEDMPPQPSETDTLDPSFASSSEGAQSHDSALEIEETSGVDLPEEAAPLFDEYGQAGETDDSFLEDDVYDQTSQPNSKTHIVIGIIVLIIAAGGFFIFKDTLFGTPAGSTVEPQALQNQTTDSAEASQANNTPTPPTDNEASGFLMDPDKAKGLSVSTGKTVEEDKNTIIDFGQPPMPMPLTPPEYINVQADTLLDESLPKQQQNPPVAEKPESTDSAIRQANQVPMQNSEASPEDMSEDMATSQPSYEESTNKIDDDKALTAEQESAVSFTEDENKVDSQESNPFPSIPAEVVEEERQRQQVRSSQQEKMPEPQDPPVKEANKPSQDVKVTPAETSDVRKPIKKAPPTQQSSKRSISKPEWVLRSAQPGVAWVAKKGDNSEMLRVTEGQTLKGIGRIERIAPVNGKWVVEGTRGSITQK